jgi:hypothetical protein
MRAVAAEIAAASKRPLRDTAIITALVSWSSE